MEATFQNSVNVLVKAYMDDTLNRMDCTRCAVGNLMRAAGVQKVWTKNNGTNWSAARDPQMFNLELAKLEFEMVGYSADDVVRIESAFMGWDIPLIGFNGNVNEWNEEKRDIFKGLLRTVDVLAEIHGIDLTEKESAKALFVKA